MPMMQPPSGPGSSPGPMVSSAPPGPMGGGAMSPPGAGGGGMMAPPMGGSAPPGMGGPPDMTGQAPPDGGPGGAPEAPDFEDAMAALVQHSLPSLNPNDMKVLAKSMVPDVAWVLSKIFGPKAITMLEIAANPQAATAPAGPTGATGLGAQAAPQPGQPSGGMPPVQ